MADFSLSYAGVPFVSDIADNAGVRMPGPATPYGQANDPRLGIYKQQAAPDLLDEINRLLPPEQLNDFTLPKFYQGKKLDGLAFQWEGGPLPNPQLKVGDWYYPNGASRFSVFRGIATSAQARAMLAETGGDNPEAFVMQCVPQGAFTPGDYTLTTTMYMLPPMPLGELPATQGYDGLYLITLVDERYYWQYSPVTLKPDTNATWTSLITACASALGINLTLPAIPSAYGTKPADDSQFWVSKENAAYLLDALAHNLGMIVVRALDGTYTLQDSTTAQGLVYTNRGKATQVVRQAGGEIFTSGSLFPVGNLNPAKNSIVPGSVMVSYPKYVTGSGPCPHYINPRYSEPRPTTWHEDSHGDTYNITIPLSSVGASVSGVTGVAGYIHSIHDTSKALYATETAAFTGVPDNNTELTTLATQIATDYYGYQVGVALDEVYPGTLAWAPEGFHDIVWTYSDKRLGARTRVLKTQWNNLIREMQHGTFLSGANANTSGVGGHSVAQTWFDQSGNTVYGTNCVTVLGGIISGQNYSGGVQQVYLTIPGQTQTTSGVPWTAGYIDNSLLVSGMKLLRFDGSGFILSGYAQSGDVDVYHAYGISGDIQTIGPNNLPGTLGKVARADHVHKLGSGAVTSGTIASGAIVSGVIGSGVYIVLASGLVLATVNQDATQYNVPVSLLVAANTLSSSTSGYRFGRIIFTDGTTSGTIGLASGSFFTTEVDWEGLRLYKNGTGYVGPEPDIEFIEGTNVTISVADSPVNERVQVTINSTATGGFALSGGQSGGTSTALTTSYQDQVRVGLPQSGVYLINGMITGGFTFNTSFQAGTILTQLFDVTAGIALPNVSDINLCVVDHSGDAANGSVTMPNVYRVSGGTTISIQAKALAMNSGAAASISRTNLTWVRII